MTFSDVPCFIVTVVQEQQVAGAIWMDCPEGGWHRSEWRGIIGLPGEVPQADLQTPFLPGCQKCGAAVPEDASRFGQLDRIFDTEDGTKAHPGAMWWMPCPENVCYQLWDNCEGGHWHVLLPNRHEWTIGSRASNCDMKEDKVHRCWQITGTPPNITVGKGSPTCGAGAGSILSGNYHGFLIDGVLTQC